MNQLQSMTIYEIIKPMSQSKSTYFHQREFYEQVNIYKKKSTVERTVQWCQQMEMFKGVFVDSFITRIINC